MSGDGKQYAYDVFLSYPGEQRELAARLFKELARLRVDDRAVQVWWDAKRMQAGEQLLPACADAAGASRHLVWIITEATPKSRYQRVEVTEFHEPDRQRRVIPILFGKKAPRWLPDHDLRRIDAHARQLSHDQVVAEVLDGLGEHGITGATPAVEVTLDRWLALVRKDHSRLIPWLGGPGALDLDRVVVDPGVCAVGGAAYPGRIGKHGRATAGRRLEEHLDGLGLDRSRPLKLRELLAPGVRLVLWGEPGCGKTTLFRHLAHHLAEQGGPVPVFVPLADEKKRQRNPFAVAAERMGVPNEARSAASQSLVHQAEKERYPVFLLDGLDEVDRAQLDATTAWLRDLPAEAAVLVSSRQQLQKEVDLPEFTEVEVKELSPEQQETLLAILLADRPLEAARLHALIRGDAQLRYLARNPMLLTLLAVLTKKDPDGAEALPRFRGDLYDKAVALLLRRGHGVVDDAKVAAVRNPDAARSLLARLAFALHGGRRESWKRGAIFDRIWKLREDEPAFARMQDAYWPPGQEHDLLDDLAANAGVFGPLDGPQAEWRFLHRSFREFLAASALAGRYQDEPAGLVAWVKEHAEDIKRARAGRAGEGPESRWGEVHAFLLGLVPDEEQQGLVDALGEVEGGIKVRAVLGAKGLERSKAAAALLAERRLEYEQLDSMVSGWGAEPEEAAATLLEALSEDTSTQGLGQAWFAIEHLLGEAPHRQEFFERAGRWPKGGPKLPALVEIPAGSFVMGATEEEAERFIGSVSEGSRNGYRTWAAAERPRHPVTLTRGFRLGVTPLTLEQYRRFDPAWKGEPFAASEPQHPINHLSWWEARACAAWLGGDLPTEAEWEHACRAGTQTAFWSGDKEKDLAEVGWYHGNSERKLQLVGGKPANPWGLHDMHGLVWEWCRDGQREYGPEPVTDPGRGLLPAGPRVSRGGSFRSGADDARSAFRFASLPGLRFVALGFRVRLPPAPGA